MAKKATRTREKETPPVMPPGDPNPGQAQPVGISLPAPTPLPPEPASENPFADDPATNPGAVQRPASIAGDTAGTNGDAIAPYVPPPGSPRLSLSGSTRKPLQRPPPIDNDDDLDEIAPEEITFGFVPPIPQVPPEEARPAPTPVEVTLDSAEETPPPAPDPDPQPAPSSVASRIDDMLGSSTSVPKDLTMPPTSPVPPPAAPNKPGAWRYSLGGCVTVVGLLLVVGTFDTTKPFGGWMPNDAQTTDPIAPDPIADREPAEQNADTAASTKLSRADEVPDAFVPLPEAETPKPIVEPAKVEVAIAPPVAVTPVVTPPPTPQPVVATVEAPKPVVTPKVAATVPTTPKPTPAPKAALPESLVVSSTGLKPACKAACAWANVDPKDGFPYTIAGRRDVTCGDMTYSVAKWEKIAEGKERFCFTATGLSDQ